MKNYNLNFISNEDIYFHVKETVEKYRFAINLEEFNGNLIDPVKLTFDSKVYKKSIDDVLESEVIRQLDKSNTNHIGYFHQNIFKYIGGENWVVPDEGFDVVNEEKQIYVEMKNKHNTMNSASSQKTYIKMQNTIMHKPAATCMLVEVIAANKQDVAWSTTVDKIKVSHKNIRRVSIDKFYEKVTGNKNAFKELCQILPEVIGDVVKNITLAEKSNTVLEELKAIDENLLKSVYLLSFKKYEGFDDFNV